MKAQMFVFRFFLCYCFVSVFVIAVQAQTLQFFYTNGQIVSADVTAEAFEWNHVSDSGESSFKTIRLSDIQELVLTKKPAAKQIAVIRQLIEQLDSPKYQEREAAEKKLSDPDLTASYIDLVRQRVDDPRLEVRVRLKRILDRLEKVRVQSKLSFDQLVLKNGTTMQGDAGNFEWDGKSLGRPIKIRRSELTSVGRATTSNADKGAVKENATVKLFHKHDSFAADKTLRVVDFSSDPNGNLLVKLDDVSNTFVPWGLKFDDSGKGYVGIPSFKLRVDSLPVGSQMIANFNNKPGRNGIPYKGVIDFKFCMPNQAATPAGVYRFGTFIATVDSPRSFILEAFDLQGDLVGTVEAEKTRCGFLGIESTIPIHRIQIRSNPYLYRVDGNVDDDYALDTFYFSKPKPIALPAMQAMNGVVLRDSTRLIGNISISAPDKVSIATAGLGQFEFKLDQLDQIGFGKLPARRLKTWMATLDDGSTVIVDPLRKFESSLLKRSVKDEMRCLFNSSTPKRFPVEGDFQQAKAVLVYPTCRIPVARVNFGNSGFGWAADAKKLLQPVDEESPLGVPGKDPTPQISEIDYRKTTAENLPTLWLGQPLASPISFVRLVDGQTLSLGKHRTISAVSGNRIELQETGNPGAKLTVPIDQVAAIAFAE